MNEEDKPTPADGQLVWVVVAFIVLMLGLLTLSCLLYTSDAADE